MEQLLQYRGKKCSIYIGNFASFGGTYNISKGDYDRLLKIVKKKVKVKFTDSNFVVHTHYNKKLLIEGKNKVYLEEQLVDTIITKYYAIEIVDRKLIEPREFPLLYKYHSTVEKKVISIKVNSDTTISFITETEESNNLIYYIKLDHVISENISKLYDIIDMVISQ